MKTIKKIKLIPLIFFALIINIAAFDWPQEEILSSELYSYFGQLRGGTVSTSLVFADTSEIKASSNGKVIAIINEYDDYSSFFPSTLGNAIILEHDDNMMSVYGNIDKQTIPQAIYESEKVTTGTIFGTSGNSGWQQGHSSLEFQTIDTKNGNAVNPRVLMPRIGDELPLYITGVILESKGEKYDLMVQRNLPSGLYRVYRKRQPIAIPYKTQVSINGALIDEIFYDQLIQVGSTLYATGRKQYQKDILYPDEQLHFLGEVNITPGKNLLGITIIDILGKEVSTSYSLTSY